MSRIYNENYTDDSRKSRVVPRKSRDEWFQWMNNRGDDFPQPTYDKMILDLESSLQIDLENLEQREYFKEEIPVKIRDIKGLNDVWTDHDEIRFLKGEIGQKRYQLELLNSIKE